ncbi:hypothetical protein ScKU66_13840 [Streptococcus canis]|nr:hypothetical protein SpKU43_01870 [Streptococcus canis]GMX39974.1 hypothetical protein ScKU71_11970 [Streptococcus canis]
MLYRSKNNLKGAGQKVQLLILFNLALQDTVVDWRLCPLFSGLPSEKKGGMKCNDKFKSHAVKMYRSGKWIEIPEGIGQKTT